MQLKDLVKGKLYSVPERLHSEGVTCYRYVGSFINSDYRYYYFNYFDLEGAVPINEYELVIEEDIEFKGRAEIEGYTLLD